MSRNAIPSALPCIPARLLREDILPALARPKAEIARLLGISRKTLYDILDEKQPITPAMALRIGKLCGNGPMLWLNLQVKYDLWRAGADAQLDKIPTLHAAE